ncbi:MAG: type VI secretion system-associated protein TagF [Rhizobiaceae bacterium]
MTTGFFGKIPATGDFVSWNLPRIFTDRWDRWMSMELRDRPDEGDLDNRAWRFAVQAGIFGDQPCAGAWRMSRDRVGRRYPFAIVRLGPLPDANDRWYDAVADCLGGAVESGWTTDQIAEQAGNLPPPSKPGAPERIVFWCDDWEVQEFTFADIHELADKGLPAMRATASRVEAS